MNNHIRRVGSIGRRSLYQLRLRARQATAPWRVLPDFLVLGAQKSGTTSLIKYLEDHPAFVAPYFKEVNYFALHYHHSLSWYKAHFPTRTHMEIIKRLHGEAFCGEATTYYMDHPLAPSRVQQTLPHARFIVLLRDPVRRAISHYHHCVFYRLEDAPTLKEALSREPKRLDGELQRLKADPQHDSYAFCHQSYRTRGIYADQLKRWFEHFPRERFLILGAHELFEQPRLTMDRVTDFLDVKPLPGNIAFKVHNSLKYHTPDDETVKELKAFYLPHNRRLCEMLGQEFPWAQ